MVIFSGKLDTNLFSTEHSWGRPYVMWAGTPYKHIVMPVEDMPAMRAGQPAMLPATGGAARSWLPVALALAGLGVLAGDLTLRWWAGKYHRSFKTG